MTIEEIVYRAYNLGLKEELFNELSKVKTKDKNKYTPLKELYEEAFKEVKLKEKITH